MYALEIKRRVNAPKDVVWNVISDLNGYADYAPNLSQSTVISGEGVGLVRQCADTRGGEWQENCILWEEGHQYTIEVDTSDYPYPFRSMRGTWGLEESSDDVIVTMRFDYQPTFDPPLLGWLSNRFVLHRAFMPIAEQLLDNWETEIHRRTTADTL